MYLKLLVGNLDSCWFLPLGKQQVQDVTNKQIPASATCKQLLEYTEAYLCSIAHEDMMSRLLPGPLVHSCYRKAF